MVEYDSYKMLQEQFESAMAAADRANASAELSIKQHELCIEFRRVSELVDKINKRVEAVLEGRYYPKK